MSRSSYSVNIKGSASPLGNPDPYLIIEKSLEVNGQQWLENVHIIEEFLLLIVQRLGQDYPQLKSSFVVRRLPNFMIPYTNKNEYAIILDKFDFSLTPYEESSPRSDKVGKPNFGQVEIFLPKENPDPLLISSDKPSNQNEEGNRKSGETETMEDCHVFLTESKAYHSHEVFKTFATAFTRKASELLSRNRETEDKEDLDSSASDQVHLVGSHLLKDLKCSSEVPKIFRVAITPRSRLSPSAQKDIATTVNYFKNYISMSYGETEVVIKPGLFYEHGYHRVNANVTERIPLYHNGILTIGESLLKGCLLFPTSYETLWTLQFWPSESHIISLFHPSSVILRLYKIYGCFSLNPQHFYETVSSNFLIGSLEEVDSLLPEDKNKLLPLDFFISSFLFELEEFHRVEDWAPRNFSTRLLHLFKSAIDSFDKGFHSHYFTKINVLRSIWRSSSESLRDLGNRNEEDGSGGEGGKVIFKELDDIRESPDTIDDYRDINMPKFMETDDLEDEFGLRLEELDIHDDDDQFYRNGGKSPPRLTSDLVYRSSINPFETFDEGPGSVRSKKGTRTSKSLSKMLGSSFLKKLGRSGGSEGGGTLRNRSPPRTVRSMSEVASEFEKSIALQRGRPSLFPFPIGDGNPTEFGEALNLASRQNLVDQQFPGTSRSQQLYDNDAFEGSSVAGEGADNKGKGESIYFCILQSIKELPPSDIASDPEVKDYMDKMKKGMESQEELISSWGKVISEIPKPKFICPHAFTTRQIQYLSRVINVVSRCSPSMIKIVRNAKLPSWEISGDVLRIVLHQMRSESSQVANNKKINAPPKKSSSFLVTTRSLVPSRPIFKSFKRDASSLADPCKLYHHPTHLHSNNNQEQTREMDPEEEMQMAMEEPETAASKRLLQWLWQLRTSEIGRLSIRADKYLEELYQVSMANSHFLEQDSEEKCFESLAIRSAVAVTKIMESGKFPAHVPLSTAARKGWLWAEMVLSLASWNYDKGYRMKAEVPTTMTDDDEGLCYLSRDILMNGDDSSYYALASANGETTLTKTRKHPIESEPDLDAVTLAFHSEFATPIGWNDIENPRHPPGMIVPILIFSLPYYKLWEVIPGNLVHALVRLQKFNTLQHVGNMLSHPHRKTALNEVRKLNKSTSFRIHHFENNIMSKTFKRLASMRTSKKRSHIKANISPPPEITLPPCLTCEQAGCLTERLRASSTTPSSPSSLIDATIAVYSNGREIECTKL